MNVMTSDRAAVSALFEELHAAAGDFARQREAAASLHRLLGEIAGFDGTQPHNRVETVSRGGVALSPLDAAVCVIDYPRTAKLTKGMLLAVAEARRRFPDSCIEVVYAGCGPFATLVLPVALTYPADEVRFTMLDYHAPSIEVARRLFERLGLEQHVAEWVQCDAATWQASRPFHMFVSETMRKGLQSEPQVAITLNLNEQIVADGIAVPECISIEATAADLSEAEFFHAEDLTPAPELGRRAAHELGPVFALSRETTRPFDGRFEAVTVQLPRDVATPCHLILATRIRVFGDVIIDDFESGLTYPTVLGPLGRLQPGTRVQLQYVLGKEPRFHYHIAS